MRRINFTAARQCLCTLVYTTRHCCLSLNLTPLTNPFLSGADKCFTVKTPVPGWTKTLLSQDIGSLPVFTFYHLLSSLIQTSPLSKFSQPFPQTNQSRWAPAKPPVHLKVHICIRVWPSGIWGSGLFPGGFSVPSMTSRLPSMTFKPCGWNQWFSTTAWAWKWAEFLVMTWLWNMKVPVKTTWNVGRTFPSLFSWSDCVISSLMAKSGASEALRKSC